MSPQSEDGTGGERMDGSGSRESGTEPVPVAAPGDPDAEPLDGEADAEATAETDSGAQTTPKPVKRRARRRSFWKELPVLIAVALVLALIIKTYALQAFFIPSGSMENTLDIGDRVLINKLVYDFRDIHRGDVVVFDGAGSWDPQLPPPSGNPILRFFTNIGQMIGVVHGEDDYVKRVIGLPGDHVVCCNAQGRITVNGTALNETSYLYPLNAPSTERFNVVVPQGCLWVMGDHRQISYDSRDHTGDPCGGAIPESSVLGRVFVRIWPPSRWGFLSIPATFDQSKLTSALGGAIDSGKLRAQPADPQLPLLFGLVGAVPLTLARRRAGRLLGAGVRRLRRRQRRPT